MQFEIEFMHQPKAGSRDSAIWDTFHVIFDSTGNEVDGFFFCLKCEEIVYSQYAIQGTTTQLLRHGCVTPHNQFKIDPLERDELTKAAAKFVTLGLRPFSELECEGLHELIMAGVKLGKNYNSMTLADLKQVLPSRNTVKSKVTIEAESAKDTMKTLFAQAKKNGGFGCTIDLWSDRYKHCTYMAMTANMFFVEEKELTQRRFVFHMGKIDEIVKSRAVVRARIIEVFRDFDMSEADIKKYVTFTTDR